MSEEGVWRTIRGRKVFIAKGDSLSDAMRKSGKFKTIESISNRIKKRKIEKYGPSIEELKRARFDNETKKLVLEDGTEIGMLDKKEYKALCKQQLENSSEETKGIVSSYTECYTVAGSAELNAITEEKLKNHNGAILRHRVCYDEKLTCTIKEADVYKEKAYQDWEKNYKAKFDAEKDYHEQSRLENEWRKKWNYDYSKTPSDYQHRERLREGMWTDAEITEAKSIYTRLKDVYDERVDVQVKYGYDSPEGHAAEERYKQKRQEVLSAVKNERLAVDNKSAYWYKSIADYDTTKVYRPDIDIEEEIRKGSIKRMTTKDLVDLDYTDKLKSMQPTDLDRSISALHRDIKRFDTAFEKDGIALDKDILVYRRGRETWEEVNNKEGFTKHGYISTSAQDTLPKKMPSGNRFGEQSYYIYIPKGTKVLFAEDVIGYDTPASNTNQIRAEKGLKRQHEIILPRNSHFTKVGYGGDSYILKMEVKKDER